MPKNSEGPYRYTQNRELSWLRFDRRVLEEAADSGVPALERLKFVSIFSSNLDEFFMVRVGSLFDLAYMTPDDTDNKTGWTPAQQLHQIYRAIPGLLTMKKQIYTAVMETLAKDGIQDASIETLDAGELKQVNRFFKTELPPALFDAYTVRESCVLAATRNADISFDDEKFEGNEEDFRRQMKKLLKQRDHLAVVRLGVNTAVSAEFQKVLSALVRVQTHQVFVDATPPNMRYVFRLISELPKELSTRLLYPVYRPRWAEDLRQNQSILAQVQQKDRLLFYPFDSVEPFLRLLNEAAENPQVLSIKMTIYRLASSSKIAQTLCRAAENGKEVLVLMELRARFDEENNLAWLKMLEESGCQVIYGAEGFKCHSKICLITLRSHNKTSYITQIGTGNYNEKTNAMYTDLSLMTADPAIGEDAAAFFRHMLVNKAGRGISAALRFSLRHQGELRHRARGHRQAGGCIAHGRGNSAHHPRHLLHSAGCAQRDGKHSCHQRRRAVSGAWAHLSVWPRRKCRDLYFIGRSYDAKSEPPGGNCLPGP